MFTVNAATLAVRVTSRCLRLSTRPAHTKTSLRTFRTNGYYLHRNCFDRLPAQYRFAPRCVCAGNRRSGNPGGVDMAYRASMDGLSLRFVRAFDVTNDNFIGRFDILYGMKGSPPRMGLRCLRLIGEPHDYHRYSRKRGSNLRFGHYIRSANITGTATTTNKTLR